jgi:hypothetical protein
MDLEMVLNELSLKTPAADIQTAKELMSELIQTLLAATESGVKSKLRTQENFYFVELAPGYPVARWCNDKDVSQEDIMFFLQLTTEPFERDVAEEIKDEFDLSEGFYQGESAMGLTFALVSDALAVSLLSESKWDCSRLELHITYLDDSEQLIEEPVEIPHASRSVHLGERADWIKNRIRIILRNGRELWQRRSELFPHLEFCESVRPQVESLNATNPMFRQVMKRLFELEEDCENWTSGTFNKDALGSKATPESDSRLRDFPEQLNIRCPDGQSRLFSWHVRMTPGAWRLHFSVDLGPGRIIVGYIGRKIQ